MLDAVKPEILVNDDDPAPAAHRVLGLETAVDNFIVQSFANGEAAHASCLA
jgi:hypothetical protein